MHVIHRTTCLTFFGIFILCCLGIQKAEASHVAAADIYWDYIGSGPTNLKYKVTLVLYKSCECTNYPPVPPWPVPLPPCFQNAVLTNTATQITFSSSCYGNIQRTFNQVGQPDTLDQLCANFAAINSCRQPGSVWPAFERRIYSDTITLPVACTDTKVSYNLCCRNGGILNLTNPGGFELYVEAGINNVAKWNNSSPRFFIAPIPYLCQNQPALFLNGPLDPNNDSMVTTNNQPLEWITWTPVTSAPINYSATYSLLNPIASAATNPYTVNPNTGTATFTPTLQGKFVLAFKCTEYDRFTGVQLSYILRDVQVSVLSCTAAPPDIDDLPQNLTGANLILTPPNGGYIVACPGVSFTFDVNALSQTVSNSVFMSGNNLAACPGSVLTVVNQGLSNPTATFTWTPTVTDIGDHTLIIEAKDSTCNNNQPIVLKNYFVIFIKVFPGVDAGPDGKICGLDGTPWQFNVTGPPNVGYLWEGLGGVTPLGLNNPNIQNPTAYPPYDFTYVVSSTIPLGCKDKDTVTILIDTSNSIKTTPSDIVLCRPDYLQLNAEGIGMKPLQNMECGILNPILCLTPDSAEVRTQFTGGSLVTSGVYTPFSADHRTARMQYLLTQNDLYAYGLRSGSVNSMAFNVISPTATPFNNFTISMKCTERTDLDQFSGGFESGLVPVYTAVAPVAVVLGWNEFVFDYPYNWDSTMNIVVEICYSNPANGTAATVDAVNTNTVQMITSYLTSGTTNICTNPTGGTTQYFNARPSIKLKYCPAPETDFHYNWYPGTFLSDSTIKSPLAYIPKSTTYYVTTRGRNGCKVRDSVVVHVPIHDYTVWPKDTTICAGESFSMIAGGGYAQAAWYESYPGNPATNLSCTNCAAPVASPTVSTQYFAVLSDIDNCSDTFLVNVIVKPKPLVNIINNDTMIKYGQRIQLLVSGAYLYSWSPISTLTNPNIINPFASPTEPTTYFVYGLAENGCRNIDSVKISIDYRDNLFVPSAFTPNGDGKNDVFRVSNITFQRLQEFRIFNRWGQEVYSTNDHKKGWDGSWKGVPQEMGTYQYLIRVAFPDGYVETYKGDVTLVR